MSTIQRRARRPVVSDDDLLARSGIPYGTAEAARPQIREAARSQIREEGGDPLQTARAAMEPKTRAFNGWRTVADERLADLVLRLLLDHESHHMPLSRARTAAALEGFRATALALFADLVHCALTGPAERGLAISLATAGERSRYATPADQPRQRNRALALFESLGWLEVVALGERPASTYANYRGRPVAGRRTVIRATPKLMAFAEAEGITVDDLPLAHHREETVVSKGPPKDAEDAERSVWLEYDDEDAPFDIKAERATIRSLNAWLAAAHIEYTDAATAHLVDLSRRTLRRFHWNDWTGSRVFGDTFWMAMPRTRDGAEYSTRGAREFIRINGHRAVTLDYSTCLPRLAFARVGRTLDRDPYAVQGYEQYRDGVKKVFAALLFRKDKPTRLPKDARELFPEGTRVGAVVAAIERHLPELRSLFGTEVGHALFRVESDILLDVLVRLRDLNIHALPIHDAVMVGESHADIAESVMLEAFEHHTGQPGLVKMEETITMSKHSTPTAQTRPTAPASTMNPERDYHAEIRVEHRGPVRNGPSRLGGVELARFIV